METIPRGIFDDITGDILIVTLLTVLTVIIIVFIYNHQKYGMNGACWHRNAILQTHLNESKTQGSGGPKNVPRDVDCSEQTVQLKKGQELEYIPNKIKNGMTE